MEPQIQYCTSADGTRIAYAVRAGTPPAILLIWGWPQTVGAPYGMTVLPERTIVQFDRRGMGASSREVQDISIGRQVEDVASIVTALGGQPIDIRANWDGTPIAIAFAAAHPEYVERMALLDPYIQGSSVTTADALRAMMDLARSNWPMLRRSLSTMIPRENAGGWSEVLRRAVSPDMAARYLEQFGTMDVSSQIERVQAPTLVVYQSGNGAVPRRAVQETASRLQHCQFVEVASIQGIAETVNGFLDRGAPPVSTGAVPLNDPMTKHSAFRTVLFTDIVGHTEMMQRLGDARGRDVLRAHERITRETLSAHGGTEVKTMGDGFMASFGSVTSAIECAISLQRAFATHTVSMPEPLHVRVGLNAGEPIEEDGDLFGATVILASRIAARAGADEILIPEPVRHLLSGKTFMFSDRGEYEMKGFDDAVRLYEVHWQE
ncbi:MAG TPA: adenylate/guanylate cyclase domain-containing protein [Dehalococcoidia bacterium]|nr:adenylate/guanylate cyclase domain-containing protein [Dehalococcoidia bacterium]